MQEGDFEMKHINSRVSSQSFNVAIAPFSLSVLGDDIDTFWILTSELWSRFREALEFYNYCTLYSTVFKF